MRRILLPVLLIFSVLLFAACSDDDNGGSEPPTAAQTGATTAVATTSTQAQSNATGPSAAQGAATSGSLAGTLPDLVEMVRPSVVSVVLPQGEGSGVIWDGDGNIVTNDHVVQGASSVAVVLASGERLPAEVVATDPLTDLAVLHVDRTGLPAATFSEELPRVGELSLAVGNPLGFESTVTLGIISGLHRSIPSGGTTPALIDLLQTDAAISPGNSGGALVDMSGEVIGVNVAFIPPQASAVALGFAIPSLTVVDVVEQLLDTGTVEHAFLGVEPRPLDPTLVSQLGLQVDQGVLVFSLSPGGAAEQAGLEPGDVIINFDGQEMTSIEDLFTALRGAAPGEEVEVTYVRGGQEQTTQVTLQERPA